MSKSPTGPARRPRPASNPRNLTKTKATGGARPSSRPPAAANGNPTRFRTRHPVLTALVPVALVVAAVATMIVVKAARTSSPSASASSHLTAGGSTSAATATPDSDTTALSPAVVAALSVPVATLDAVGNASSVVLPTKVGNGTVLRATDGKPLITYVGAEYCPFCAAERWALAVALSRFGTFENLSGTHSSSTDAYPDTQTLSFYGSSYSSPYVDFQAVEEATNQPAGASYQALQTPTAAQSALMAKFDTQGSIPFLDIANRYVVTGSSFSPQVLQGLSRSQIAADLANPQSEVAQAIDGAANSLTAAIASVTGNQPSSVGGSAAIAAIAQRLGA